MGELAERHGDLIGFSDRKEEHGGKHWTKQGKGRRDAMGQTIVRADLEAFAAVDVGVVDDVVGYKVGRKGSSSVDNADRALPWGQAFADMDTIAVVVVAENGAAEEEVGRDVDRVDTYAAYEVSEEALLLGSECHAVACHCEEELPAGQVHGLSSSRAGKPRGLLLRASHPRQLLGGFFPRHV